MSDKENLEEFKSDDEYSEIADATGKKQTEPKTKKPGDEDSGPAKKVKAAAIKKLNSKGVKQEAKGDDDDYEDDDDDDDNVDVNVSVDTDDDDDDDDNDKKDMKKEMKHKKKKMKSEDLDIDDDLNAIFEGTDEADLSEEFKEKVKLVFETTILSIVNKKIDELTEEFESTLEETVDEIQEGMSERLDTYLNYVIEDWHKENELVLEKTLRAELMEDFISGMKVLFEEHYIDVPEDKIDVLEATLEKNSELDDELNKKIHENVNLKAKLESYQKKEIVEGLASDLSENQKEKFFELAENVSFNDADEFEDKCVSLKESYFGSDDDAEFISEDIDPDSIQEDEYVARKDVDPQVARFADAIGRTWGSGTKKVK